MIKPWCERQRQALRAFRQAILIRAQREREIAEGAQTRQIGQEEHYAAEKQRVEDEHAGAQAQALTRSEHTRKLMQDRHAEANAQIEREYHEAKAKHTRDY